MSAHHPALNHALNTWHVRPAHIELVAHGSNLLYQVTDTDGHAYAVRLHTTGRKSAADFTSEAVWLQHLASRGIPAPVPAFPVLTLPDAVAVAFHWRAGNVKSAATHTVDDVRRIGTYLATLHHAAQDFTPPHNFQRPTLDADGLFGERSPYASSVGAVHISESAAETLDAVGERVAEVMTTLGTSREMFGLIHADFIYKNTLFTSDGTVCGLDFEECAWGYFIYDMACPLLFYRGRPDADTLTAALWDGYTSIQALNVGHKAALHTFIAGRYAASCRWVAANADHPSFAGQAREVIDGRAAELRVFLQDGILPSD
jgi:Ser/Thr protein kinase RdoA (MazF antagonist)